MKLHRPEPPGERFHAGREPLATFRPAPALAWVLAIFHDRVCIRVAASTIAEIPFTELQAVGTGAFRVSYPASPQELTAASSRHAAALVLYLDQSVSLAELQTSQDYWDPARRHIWTHSGHGLMIEWDGLEPGLAVALDLLKAPRAHGELEIPVSLAPAPPAEAAGSPQQDGRAVGGLVALMVILGIWLFGGPDEGKDRALVVAQKRRGQPVLERQGSSQVTWGQRIWDRRGRQTFGCVGFEATRLGRRESGRYCEPGGEESYVVWNEDRVGR